ncbi:MAG: histidinol dehydrogenase [Terriglobales bacterium]
MTGAALRIVPATPAAALQLRAVSRRDAERAGRVAAGIIADVRRRGIHGLDAWRRKLEAPAAGAVPLPLRVPPAELPRAWRRLAPALQAALRQAHDHVRRMAEWQRPAEWRRQIAPGVRVGQVVRPLDSVGCYVPAGRHPLPSTLLMTAVPARAAGVGRIAVACPAPADAVLGAAWLAGVTEVYRMGGAQAIAALAYGAGPVAAVDKIVGPGNRFVTAAKELVRRDCEVDFLAGPTEVLWLADAQAPAEFIAADLIAQAEHDPDAAAWAVVLSRRQAAAVVEAVTRQLAAAPNPTARRALRRRGAILVARDRRQALAAANALAAEHVTLPAAWLPELQAGGSVFLGVYSPVAAGDYLTGPNHVLPTGGGARRRGGLSVSDFLKVITVQELSRTGLRRLAPAIAVLARAEGLEAHARSIEARLTRATARGIPRRRGPRRGQ